MIIWKTEKRRIKDLKLFEGNPRKMSEAEAENLMSSLKKFNLAEIPAIDTKNRILAGNMRITALKKLGREDEEIDVRVPDRELTEEEAREYLLRSNRNTGQWDFDLLANFGEDELMTCGFDSEELDQIFLEEAIEDDFDAESEYAKTETDIKSGDLFQLGRHKLLCGDATKREDVEKLMGGEKADMVWTDPPYVIYGSSTGISSEIADGKMIMPFLRLFFQGIKKNIKIFAHGYICCDWRSWHLFYQNARESLLEISNMIIWDKMFPAQGAMYRPQFEILMFIQNSPEKTVTGIRRVGKRTVKDTNIWQSKRVPSAKRQHGAEKPIEIIERAIRNSSKRGELILDLFGGSGSTLISAEKEGRKCFMMEIDPIYCQIILNRFEKLTGLKVKKI